MSRAQLSLLPLLLLPTNEFYLCGHLHPSGRGCQLPLLAMRSCAPRHPPALVVQQRCACTACASVPRACQRSKGENGHAAALEIVAVFAEHAVFGVQKQKFLMQLI